MYSVLLCLCFGCIILRRGEGPACGHRWQHQALAPVSWSSWPARDITHPGPKKPHRCSVSDVSTGDISHLITGSKNREGRAHGEWKEVWYGKLEDILLCRDSCVCPVRGSAVFRDTRQLSWTATQPGATQQPRPALGSAQRRNTSSVETETRYPSHHRDQEVVTTVTSPTSGWRGPLWHASGLWQSSLMASVLWIRCHRT